MLMFITWDAFVLNPQEYITQKDSVDIPQQYQILSGNSVQDGPALPLLRSLMPEEVLGASFRVYIWFTMGNKNTVIDAEIANLNELTKALFYPLKDKPKNNF